MNPNYYYILLATRPASHGYNDDTQVSLLYVIYIKSLLQSILGVSAVNPLVAFYDIHERKGEMLIFCLVPDTTRDLINNIFNIIISHNFLIIVKIYD
jgi:hypothetical protein